MLMTSYAAINFSLAGKFAKASPCLTMSMARVGNGITLSKLKFDLTLHRWLAVVSHQSSTDKFFP